MGIPLPALPKRFSSSTLLVLVLILCNCLLITTSHCQVVMGETVITDANGFEGPDASATVFGPGTSGRFDFSKLDNGFNPTPCQSGWTCFPLTITIDASFVSPMGCVTDYCGNIFVDSQGAQRKIFDSACNEIWVPSNGNAKTDYTFCVAPGSSATYYICKSAADPNPNVAVSFHNCCTPSLPTCPPNATLDCSDTGSTVPDYSGIDDATVFYGVGGSIDMISHAPCAACNASTGCMDISYMDSGALDFCTATTLTRTYTIELVPEINFVRLGETTDANGNPIPDIGPAPPIMCSSNITTIPDASAPTITCPPDVVLALDAMCSSDLTMLAPAMVMDACGPVAPTFTDDTSGLTGCSGTGTIVRTWTAADACGNMSSCMQNVTIEDQTMPMFACPTSVTLLMDATCMYDLTTIVPPVAMDNCPGAVVTFADDTAGLTGCSGTGTIVRTWTATDACLNTSSCTQDIIIEDQTAPTLTCPGDITMALDMACAYDLTMIADPVFSDNCPGATVGSVDDLTGLTGCSGTGVILRTWTVTDACMNTVSCMQNIAIEDQDIPMFTCPAAITLAIDATCAIDLSSIADPVITDNCPGATIAFADDMGGLTGCSGTGTIVRTWTATDACMLTSTCTQTITIEDQDVPAFACPAGVTIPMDAGCMYDLTTIADPVITDNCPGSTMAFADDLTGLTACSGTGTIIRTWTATDACLNTSSCTQDIIIEDQTAPMFTCPVATTIAMDAACTYDLTTIIPPAVMDNCPGSSIAFTDDLTGLSGCAGTGLIVRTWTATDACLTISSCTQDITIEDQTAPTFICPAAIIIALDGACNYDLTTIVDPIISENCPGASIASSDDLSGLTGCSGTGLIVRTWTATDACLNTSSCIQDITIEDQEVPAFTCPAAITLAIDATCVADLSSIVDPVIMDNCPGATMASSDDLSGLTGCSGTGLIVRTWTATDACLNTSSCTQDITIEDQDAPTFTCPMDVILALDATCTNDLSSIVDPVITDNCPGSTMTISDDVTGLTGCNGTGLIIRTWAAADLCGNTTTCLQNITLEDQTAPSITCPAVVTISKAPDCTYDVDPLVTDEAVGTDNCAIPSFAYADDITGLTGCSGTGTIVRTWTATDLCGLTSNCTQNIIIEDIDPPSITCPADLDLVVGDPNNDALIAAWLLTIASADNCTATTVTDDYDPANFMNICGASETQTVTFIATDDCGNTAECMATVTIGNTTPPIITCPANLVLDCADPNNPTLIANWLASVMATPVGGGGIVTSDNYTGAAMFTDDCGGTGMAEVLFTATDDCMLMSMCTANIIIQDITPPTITCPMGTMIMMDGSCAYDAQPVTIGMASGTDDCAINPIVSTYVDDMSGLTGCSGTGTILRDWSIADECGNVSSCTQVIIVIEDMMDPIINCPGDVLVSLDNACVSDITPATVGTATGSDNCSIPTFTYTDDLTGLSSCNGTGTIVRTWQSEDDCLNTNTCIQNLTIIDDIQPSFICPAAITLQLDGSCLYDLSTILPPTIADNCPAPMVTFSDDLTGLTGCSGTGTIVRTWTATDGCSNVFNCTQDITIEDTGVPVITCPSPIVAALDADCIYDISEATTGSATATDNCTTITITSVDDLSGLTGCSNTGVVTRAFTASDDCGNTSSCTQLITIEDNSSPVITCAGGMIIPLDGMCSYDLISVVPPAVMDNCPGITLSFVDDVTGLASCNGTGDIVRTWQAEDACANISTCMQTITIEDQTLPSFMCPVAITLNLDALCMYDLTSISNPITLDNCPGTTISFADDLTGLGACNGTGVIVRSWTAADACMNTFACNQNIFIEDATPPSFTCPATVTLYMDATCMYDLTTIADPAITDNCTGAVISYSDDLAGLTTCNGTGTIVRTWLGTDGCNNTFSCVQNILIEDIIPPTITCPGMVTQAMTTNCTYDLTVGLLGNATATDNCDAASVISFTDDATGLSLCNGTGTIYRNFAATDACGNASTCQQVIVIEDTTLPVITCPGAITIPLDAGCGANLAALGKVISYDNCPGAVVTTSDNASGLTGCSFTGVLIRTYTVTDNCGNSASCDQFVTLEDQTPPSFTCPMAITVDQDASCMYDLSTILDPAITDNCVGSMMSHTDDMSALLACNNAGIITRTWTATDACGNTSTCNQEITIQDIIATQITCPADAVVTCETDIMQDAVVITGTCMTGDVVATMNPTLLSGVDDCSGATYEQVYTVTDGCGNTASCTQILTLMSAPLSITCPPDQNVAGPFDVLADPTLLTYMASCNVGVGITNGPVVSDPANSACGETDGDIYTIVYTVTDVCGTIENCTQTFTVVGGAGCYDCTDIATDPIGFCNFVLSYPTYPMASIDCDGDGQTNFEECDGGSDPGDPCSNLYPSVADLCTYILANPTSPLALADCDGGGIDNITECLHGDDPTDPGDDCNVVMDGTVDICAMLFIDPTNPLATVDCDGDGQSNLDECNGGSFPNDPCSNLYTLGADVCTYVLANPTSPLALADCDGGGIDNITECLHGDDPTDPGDDCNVVMDGTVDICAMLFIDPTNPLATVDCDGDGQSNLDECNGGSFPNDPCSNLYTLGADVCTYVLANPTSPLALADCDGGGIDNITECLHGDDPTDPGDDCNVVMDGTVDICAMLFIDPTNPLATVDCDGDGQSNLDECNGGSFPNDPCSNLYTLGADVCTYVLANPTSPLALADCDGGGIDNITECLHGDDPTDPGDDCNVVMDGTVDICAMLFIDPTNPLATVDCDGDGQSNLDECNGGSNPNDPCDNLYMSTGDICAFILANPTSPLAQADCDGGGIINLIECQNGQDPEDPSDECDLVMNGTVDICQMMALDPSNPLLSIDCDGDGIANGPECTSGSVPTDPCSNTYTTGADVCDFVTANPLSPLALADCDMGGVSNYIECALGNDPILFGDDFVKLGDKVWHDCNGNGIQDPTEEGIGQVRVEVYDKDENLVTITTTDANGNYLVSGLLPGQYYVKFIAQGWDFTPPSTGGSSLMDSDVTGFYGEGTTSLITLSPAECNLEDFDAGLYRCIQLGEHIWLDSNMNDVRDANENGINGLKVELFRWDGTDWDLYADQYSGHKPGTASDDGYYKFCVPPGRYYLKFKNPPVELVPVIANSGNNANLDSEITGGFGPYTSDEIVLNCGEDRCDVGAGFYRMGSLGDYVWHDLDFDGLMDASENGVPGVLVQAINSSGTSVAQATTDANGNYMIDYLGKGLYFLEFTFPNGYIATYPNMGTDEEIDSDLNDSHGPNTTDYYLVMPDSHTPNIDVGVVLDLLPITWTDFWGENRKTFNYLEWGTASERNSSHFEIERSLGGTDNFVRVGSELSAGTTSVEQRYNFEDYNILTTGVYYYRIKQIDLDGQFDYSEVIAINITGRDETVRLELYPNPVLDELKLRFETTSDIEELSVKVYDNLGQRILDYDILDFDISAGIKDYGLDLSDLPAGTYNIKAIIDRQTLVKKIIKID